MFLSRLALDPMCRDVRRDLANGYDLHRTLLRGFPDAVDGGAGRVLFRLDAGRGEPIVLVQSAVEPDWSRFPTGYLATAEPGDEPFRVTPFDIDRLLKRGPRYAFRLRANPAKRVRETEAVDPRWVNRRVGLVREGEQEAWLQRKAIASGFRILGVRAVPEGAPRLRKADAELTLVAVRFDGVLEVTDAAAFRLALRNGIGPGKGLGFGLLSVAPAPG